MAAQRAGLVGQSDVHQNLLGSLYNSSQFNVEVFLIGETGVGKERYARFIHESSPRSNREFVGVNCGAIPEALFESELFGHSSGAYTDAKSPAEGLVAAAEGGTLFLDEVDSLSKTGQVKLLRLLQEKEYRRLGETKLRKTDIRILCAINRTPESAIKEGAMREDLFYRLCVHRIEIAPLRERPSDVPLLMNHFVDRYAKDYGRRQALGFSNDAIQALCAYRWPGNVRQLENLIRSLVCQHSAPIVETQDLPAPLFQDPFQFQGRTPNAAYDTTFNEAKHRLVEQFEIKYICQVLHRSHGNISKAAKFAGKDRRAFFELMRKHNIDAHDFKSTSADGAFDSK